MPPTNSPTFLANCCFWNPGWGTGPGTLTLLRSERSKTELKQFARQTAATSYVARSATGSPGLNWKRNVRVGFPPISEPVFGQTWPRNPSRTAGLVLQCRLYQKSAPQTNSKAISWRHKIPARLPSGTQVVYVRVSVLSGIPSRRPPSLPALGP